METSLGEVGTSTLLATSTNESSYTNKTLSESLNNFRFVLVTVNNASNDDFASSQLVPIDLFTKPIILHAHYQGDSNWAMETAAKYIDDTHIQLRTTKTGFSDVYGRLYDIK